MLVYRICHLFIFIFNFYLFVFPCRASKSAFTFPSSPLMGFSDYCNGDHRCFYVQQTFLCPTFERKSWWGAISVALCLLEHHPLYRVGQFHNCDWFSLPAMASWGEAAAGLDSVSSLRIVCSVGFKWSVCQSVLVCERHGEASNHYSLTKCQGLAKTMN